MARVGKCIAIDLPMITHTRPGFARVCVELNLLTEKPGKIWLGPKETSYLQDIEYDKYPDYCSHCHLQDHGDRYYKIMANSADPWEKSKGDELIYDVNPNEKVKGKQVNSVVNPNKKFRGKKVVASYWRPKISVVESTVGINMFEVGEPSLPSSNIGVAGEAPVDISEKHDQPTDLVKEMMITESVDNDIQNKWCMMSVLLKRRVEPSPLILLLSNKIIVLWMLIATKAFMPC